MSYVDVDFRLYPESLQAKFIYSFNSLCDDKNANFEFKDFRNLLFKIADECQMISSIEEKTEVIDRRRFQIRSKFDSLNKSLVLAGMRRDGHKPIIILAEKDNLLIRTTFFFSGE